MKSIKNGVKMSVVWRTDVAIVNTGLVWKDGVRF